ncbi:acyltransferase family protein [Nesterenkonia sp. LB17]|uniref:acyltransferase family protein n=1 Tax=unclassified Nesterenkonia TaxID=2629769 RepID=UPI001F4CDE80|nr:MULTISPECIES: acyltransferase family protein [unclassified Nesterenkonia]MCH8563843.1 acyltransferase family protein [Nesterenkonia sp. YGD6]MCH8566437.1 acyltransferase family protein [Nesterenkonia sp. LB17]MCH8571996.1 acyltransferase family protein [Nesterenkonia sp. AY15]
MTAPAPRPVRARNLGIDLLRVISVAAVVLGHAWAGMPGAEYLQIWRMPLFFFLAGFFFSTSRTVREEFLARSRSLALPYLVWFVLLSVAVLAMVPTPWPFDPMTVPQALFGGAMTNMPFLVFWFISVLFFAALLLRAVLSQPWWVGVAVAVGGLAVAQIPGSVMGYTPLGIGLAPACMAFMLAGHWFGRFMRSPRGLSLPARPWLGLLCLSVGFGAVAAGVRTMNIKYSGFGTFLLSPAVSVLISIGLVLVFSSAVNALLGGPRPQRTSTSSADGDDSTVLTQPRRGRILGVVISELVQTATFVVFAHAIILYLLLRLFALENPPLRTLAALLLCWGLGMLVNRSPLSLPLNGLPRSALRRPAADQTGGKIASNT